MAEEMASMIRGMDAFDRESGSTVAQASRLLKRIDRLKRIPRLTEELNLFDAARVIKDGRQAWEELGSVLQRLEDTVERTQLASDNADEVAWAQAFEAALRERGVPFQAEFPLYRVFPFEVRVDLADQSAWVKNRLTHVVRPALLARLVERERAKLYAERFNHRQFMKALATVYPLLQGSGGFGVALKDAYKLLSARTGPSGYTVEQFAFDLYRLRYQSDMVYEGKRFVFNPSRSARGAIPVPHPNGGVENLGSFEIMEHDA